MTGEALVHRPAGTVAPIVVSRTGHPAELDRFPGGVRAQLGLSVLCNLVATYLPNLILGAHVSLAWRVLMAGGLGALGGALVFQGLPWFRKQRLRRVVEWSGIGAPPGGANLRVVGTIEPLGRPFELPETSGTLVYARTRFLERFGDRFAGAPAVDDIRGILFQVRLDSETAIRVAPELVRSLDEPRPLNGPGDEQHRALALEWPGRRPGPITRVALAPGDRVELVGRLQRQVAPDGEAAPARGIPFVLVAGPSWDGSVWLRRLP